MAGASCNVACSSAQQTTSRIAAPNTKGCQITRTARIVARRRVTNLTPKFPGRSHGAATLAGRSPSTRRAARPSRQAARSVAYPLGREAQPVPGAPFPAPADSDVTILPPANSSYSYSYVALPLDRRHQETQLVSSWPSPSDANAVAAVDAPARLSGISLSRGFRAALDRVPAWQRAVALVASSNVACAMCRGAMTVSVFPMASAFDWNTSYCGLIQSGFFVGFTVSSFLGGFLATRIKPEALLGFTVAGTALFTALTPLAAYASADGSHTVLLVRILTGCCEGLIYPSIQGLISTRVPSTSCSSSLALCYSGAEVGNVVALASSPALIDTFGWASNFYLFSTCGVLWLGAWQNMLGSECQHAPSPAPAATSASLAVQETEAVPSGDVSWSSMLQNKAYRAVLASHATYQMGNLITLSWLPTFFCRQCGADLHESAAMSVLPWLMAVLTSNGAGQLADALVTRAGVSPLQTRKVMQTIASGGPAACLLILASSSGSNLDATHAMIIMTAMIGLAQFKAGGYGPNFMELSPNQPSMLCGASTSLASIFGTLAVMATGMVLDTTHSWGTVFTIMATLHLCSLRLFLQNASTEPQNFTASKNE